MFSTDSSKICCSFGFAKNKIFEKSKMAAKLAGMFENGCCHDNSS